jgi:iron-sulfur cluster repair protein YtfE (RIC family)
LTGVKELLVVLHEDLLPHEEREEAELLPAMADTLGGADPVGALSRTHAEIHHLVARLAKIVDTAQTDPDADPADSVREARRTLYSLYAVLRLHNAQEDEGLFSLIE